MDRQHLIAEVRKRPALWDFQSGENKTRICVPDMWKDVANSMGPNVTVAECKRKWKNLRDAYRAEVKRIEQRIERDLLKGSYDSKNEYNSKWAYFETMKFINDVRRPRRNKIIKNSCSFDNADGDNDSETYSQFQSKENIKLEPEIDVNSESYTLDNNDGDLESENLFDENRNVPQSETVDENRYVPQSQIENSNNTPSTTKQHSAEENPTQKPKQPNDHQPSNCKCPKRTYDQVHFLENLEKEEQKLIKSTRMDITRSKDLPHIDDSDYNFLVSFLPQMKKMSDLQNLQFRAKISELVLNIMSSSLPINTLSVSSTLGFNDISNNYT